MAEKRRIAGCPARMVAMRFTAAALVAGGGCGAPARPGGALGAADLHPKPHMRVSGSYSFRQVMDLTRPVPVPLDSQMMVLTAEFLAAPPLARHALRGSLEAAANELLFFGRRAAVFAIRERKPEWIRGGLAAAAMVDYAKVDFREAILSMAMLHHAAEKIGEDPRNLFDNARAIAEHGMAEAMTAFLGREYSDRRIRAFGFDEVETDRGPGFIARMGQREERWEPSYDLKRLIIDVSDVLERDDYDPGLITIVAYAPAAWLRTEENAKTLDFLLGRVRAAVDAQATLRGPEFGEPHESFDAVMKKRSTHTPPELRVYVAELEDESSARALAAIARSADVDRATFHALAQGRLAVVLMSTTPTVDGKPRETAGQLARFDAPLRSVLQRYPSQP